MDILLKPGDIVIDAATGDVGLLVNRYCLFEPPEAYYTEHELSKYEKVEIRLWAWDVYWTGPDSASVAGSRYQPYTEEGLINLIKTGTFIINREISQ